MKLEVGILVVSVNSETGLSQSQYSQAISVYRKIWTIVRVTESVNTDQNLASQI